MAASKKPKKPVNQAQRTHKVVKAWEPDARQLEWHRLWAERFLTFVQIAATTAPKVTRQAVQHSVHKTEEWLRGQHYSQIGRIKGRQTRLLEKIVAYAMKQYEEGKRRIVTLEEGNTPGENGGHYDKKQIRQEKQDTKEWLAEARAAMADIRKIWGGDAPTKQSVEVLNSNEIEGLPGMNGFTEHRDFLKATAKAIGELADAQPASSEATP